MADDTEKARSGQVSGPLLSWALGLLGVGLVATVTAVISARSDLAVIGERLDGIAATSGANRPDRWGKSDDERTMKPVYDAIRHCETEVDAVQAYMFSDVQRVEQLLGKVDRLQSDMAECKRKMRSGD